MSRCACIYAVRTELDHEWSFTLHRRCAYHALIYSGHLTTSLREDREHEPRLRPPPVSDTRRCAQLEAGLREAAGA